MTLDRPLVSLWKREWLPASETFIRAQQDGLRRWRAEAVGWDRVPSTLARSEDVLLGEGGRRGRLRANILALTGRSPRLTRHWLATRPDLIHVHFLTQAKGVARIARRLGIPLVVTVHGNDVTEAPAKPGLRGCLYRWQARRILRSASAVIAVSGFLAQRALALGAPPQKLRVLPVGVAPADRVDVPVTRDVVFVGRLVEVKGVTHLLTALEILSRRGRPVTAAVAGAGPLAQELRQRSEDAGLDVEFVGAIPHSEVPRFMASGRVFCAPSTASARGAVEGFGLVNLEAALQERPVVAFRSGGVPESVEHRVTGLLVDDGDDEALADALWELIEGQDRAAELGRAGRRRVLSRFSLEHCTARLEATYDEVRG